jgi:hypothetical protein
MTTELDVLGLVSHRFSARFDANSDTSAAISMLVSERFRAMTPTERCLIASSLFDSARKIVEASLPYGLTIEQRRLAIIRRLYGDELPEAALLAHARYDRGPNVADPT